MSTISRVDSFEEWRVERERDLDRWEDASTSEEIESVLNKITNAGNAERALAGSHEGREILELLQNARDAISNGETEAGQVYVGVFETGVLVANTGEPFDLLDGEIMNTVRKVGESKKEGDSIGHKGVGLNSVLSVGDAFEVWSRLPDLDEPLRVRYSRAYLTAALAQRFGHDISGSSFCSDIRYEALVEDADGQRLLTAASERNTAVPLPDDVAKLPLFWYPWPLQPEANSSLVATRAYDLLTAPRNCLGTFETPPAEPFRTAVFIEYEDTQWRELLDRLDIASPDKDEEQIDASEQARLLWEYLADTADRSTSLRPETLVQLGEIEDLYIERIDADGATTGAEHWNVTREPESVPDDTLQYEHVETTINHRTRATRVTRSFDRFWRTDCSETEPSLLVPRQKRESIDTEEGGQSIERSRSEYPLYLFYPINRTERHSLPFCLHGRFRVSTDRQDLSQSAKAHNLDVLEDGVELVEQVAEVTAELTAKNSDRWAIYPWVLLPPQTDQSPTDPASTVELMEWICTEIYNRLKNTCCFPDQQGGQHSPGDATVHPEKQVVDGFVAGLELAVSDEPSSTRTSLPPLPHIRELKGILETHPIWKQRIEALVIEGEDRAVFTDRILGDWTTYLGDELSGGVDDPIAIEVEKGAAHTLFEGSTTLIKERAEQVGGSGDVLKSYASTLDGVYLLPCEQADSTTNSWLVQIEYRETPGASRSARTVVWGRAEDLQSDDFPPEHGEFDVYFLEEAIQEPTQGILSNAGDYWGMRQSDGFAELYRSLLGTFGTGRRMEVDAGSLGALATLITRVNESRATSLRTDEASFFPSEYAKNAPESSKRERRRQINTRLRLRQVTLEVLDETPLADLTFPTAWQRERALARHNDKNAGENAEPETVAEWKETADLSGPSLPSPTDSLWEEVPVTEVVPDKQRRLARLLSLLGVSALPGLRVLWMYGPEHPEIKNSSQPHWNPLEWEPVEQRQELREMIADHEDYLSWLTSVSHHPSQSASHAYSCSKSPVLEDGGSGSNLVGWIWFDPERLTRLVADPEALIETLGRHGQQYVTTVLSTNWFCKSYQTCDPSHSLPTLANWQLRQLPIWDSILDVGVSVKEYWGEDGDRLAWAVIEGSQSGAQGWRLFPRVDPEDIPLSGEVLENLGVPELDDLSVSEAEYRLQKLQAVLADDLSETQRTLLDIPPERKQDWGGAYSKLLQPIMRHVSSEEIDDIEEFRDQFTYLTHIPLRRIHGESDKWLAAPLSWVADNADEVCRYPEESPTPWEQKRVRDKKWDLLDFPQLQAGFADFASALGIEKVEAHKPVPSVDDDDFELVDAQRQRIDLKNDRQALQRRQTLLLASIGTSDDDRIVEEAENLETTINNLAVAESFPERVAEQLSDPRSGLYRTAEGETGLVYNKEEAEGLERDALAMGLALLFEQYRNVSVFETALDPEQSRRALRERWRKETFPIQTVQTVIEDHTRRSVRKKLSAGRDLLVRGGVARSDVPTAETIMEEFDTKDVTAEETHILSRIGDAVQSGAKLDESVPFELSAYINACQSEGQWVQMILTKLFDADETVIGWRDLVEESVPDEKRQDVIEWLVEYQPLFDASLVTDEFVPTVERFVAVYRTWARTSDHLEQLESPEAWRAAVRDQHRAASPELADRVPTRLREIADISESHRWFSFRDEDELTEAAVDPFLEYLGSEVGVDATVREMLDTFVSTHDFGLETDEQTRHGHKNLAYAAAEDAIMSDRVDEFDPVRIDEWPGAEADVGNPSDSAPRVSSGKGNGGGGSSQLRGRGEQAEVAIALELLQSVHKWLRGDDQRYDTYTKTIRDLYEDQQEKPYRWHTTTEWDDNLLPLLDNPSRTVRHQFTDYRKLLGEGMHLDDLAPVKLLDVSGENGPGFDVIDPFGTLYNRDGDPPNWSLNPAPVEIKAVSGDSAPFDFRFTTNELRQAKRFTREGERYVLRFVYVPEPGNEDWLPKTRCVHERVFTSPKEFDRMIEGHPFEDAVKGGYLNISVGGRDNNN